MAGNNFAADYVDVATRIREFREKHPEGVLRPANPDKPFWIENVEGVGLRLVYVAAAYRTPDDPTPAIGCAWEPLPGKTPYTRDSELMVAETSAWGRAIVACLAADTKKSVASADEVRARQAEQTAGLHDDVMTQLQETFHVATTDAELQAAVDAVKQHLPQATQAQATRLRNTHKAAAQRVKAAEAAMQ